MGVNLKLCVITLVHFSVGSISEGGGTPFSSQNPKRMIDPAMITFDRVPIVGCVKPLKSLGI